MRWLTVLAPILLEVVKQLGSIVGPYVVKQTKKLRK